MQDFLYPLPKKNLISRFKPVFDILNRGLSGSLVSLPHTGKSSLIQFVLSQPELLKEFKNDRKFIYLNPENFGRATTENLYKNILSQLSDKLFLISDEYYLLNEIIKHSKHPITFVMDWLEGWKSFSPEAGIGLKSIWENGQHKVPHLINFILLSPPSPTVYPFFQPLKSILSENIINFPLLDQEECRYSILRFSQMWSRNVSAKEIDDIINKSSGVAGLIKPLLSDSGSQDKLNIICKNLLPYAKDLPKGSYIQQLIDSYLPTNRIGDLEFEGNLGAQEITLLQKFLSEPGKLFSRDQIAEALWGKLANEKYSDWAIDKAISRLRKKLKYNPKNKILTVKNMGYKYIIL